MRHLVAVSVVLAIAFLCVFAAREDSDRANRRFGVDFADPITPAVAPSVIKSLGVQASVEKTNNREESVGTGDVVVFELGAQLDSHDPTTWPRSTFSVIDRSSVPIDPHDPNTWPPTDREYKRSFYRQIDTNQTSTWPKTTSDVFFNVIAPVDTLDVYTWEASNYSVEIFSGVPVDTYEPSTWSR